MTYTLALNRPDFSHLTGVSIDAIEHWHPRYALHADTDSNATVEFRCGRDRGETILCGFSYPQPVFTEAVVSRKLLMTNYVEEL